IEQPDRFTILADRSEFVREKCLRTLIGFTHWRRRAVDSLCGLRQRVPLATNPTRQRCIARVLLLAVLALEFLQVICRPVRITGPTPKVRLNRVRTIVFLFFTLLQPGPV